MYKMYMTGNEFNVWVKNAYNSFQKFHKEHLKWIHCYSYQDLGITIIINIKTGKIAKSTCSKTDSFSSYIGIAIAWARYNGWIVPELVEKNLKLCYVREGSYILYKDNKYLVSNHIVDFMGNLTTDVLLIREDGTPEVKDGNISVSVLR